MPKTDAGTTATKPIFLPTIALLIAQLAVGSAAIMARIGLQSGLSSLSLAAWRLLIALAIVLASANLRKSGRSTAIKSTERLPIADQARLILAGICLGLHFLTWFLSLEYVSIARSTLLVTTSPIWTGLASTLFLKQQMGAKFWIGLAMACLGGWGVTLLGTHSPGNIRGEAPFWGDPLALAGAITISAYYLLVDPVQRRFGTARTIAWTYTVSALTLWPAVLLSPSASLAPQNSVGWWAVLGMALIPQLIGHTAMNWSLLHFPAAIVGAANLLEPIVAGVLAYIIFGELVTGKQIAAAVLLLAGVGITLRSQPVSLEPGTEG